MTARLLVALCLFALDAAASVAGAPLRPISGAPEVPQCALEGVDWADVRETGARYLSELIRIRSLSGEEADAADFLERAARELGLEIERMDGEGTFNVYAATRLAGPPMLLMLSHLDTVRATPDAWSQPPFPGVRVDGAVWDRVYAALEDAIRTEEPTALVSPLVFPASSDNNAFRQAGNEAYGIFPVRLARAELEAIHGVDERLTEKAIEQGVSVLVDVMLRLRGAGAST